MAKKNNYFNETTENDVRRYIEATDKVEKEYYFTLIYNQQRKRKRIKKNKRRR